MDNPARNNMELFKLPFKSALRRIGGHDERWRMVDEIMRPGKEWGMGQSGNRGYSMDWHDGQDGSAY
jgi:hypothetical protein